MKQCPNCNTNYKGNEKFCTTCGMKLIEVTENGIENQQTATVVDSMENQQTTTSEDITKNQQTCTSEDSWTKVTENTTEQNQSYRQNIPGNNSGQTQDDYQNTSGNNYGQNQNYYQNAPVDIYDHTAEFDLKDISENKVYAMLGYLLGTAGIIIALLAGRTSKYASFHVRQAVKFVVVEYVLGIITLLLCWTFIVPIIAGIMFLALFIVRIIAFFQICGGKAIEPYIIRSFGFLK